MADITIEIFQNDFKTGVIDLILEIQQHEFHIPITLEQQPDLLDIDAFYQRGAGNFWIAKSGEAIVGSIALLGIGNNQGALRKMFVAKNFRGKEYGLAQRLLETLFFWAKTNNFKEIFLGTTAQFLAAQRFYEKNGFREIPKTLLPDTFPIMDVDVKFYQYIVE